MHIATRRGILGTIALAPVAIAIPAAASSDFAGSVSPVMRAYAHNKAAISRFCALDLMLEKKNPSLYQAEVERMIAASHALFDTEPRDMADMAALIDAASEGGADMIDSDMVAILLGHARRLAA